MTNSSLIFTFLEVMFSEYVGLTEKHLHVRNM